MALTESENMQSSPVDALALLALKSEDVTHLHRRTALSSSLLAAPCPAVWLSAQPCRVVHGLQAWIWSDSSSSSSSSSRTQSSGSSHRLLCASLCGRVHHHVGVVHILQTRRC